MTPLRIYPRLLDFRIERRERIQGWLCKWVTDPVAKPPFSALEHLLWAEVPDKRRLLSQRGHRRDLLRPPVLVIAVGTMRPGRVLLVFEPGPRLLRSIPWSGDEDYFRFYAWQIAKQELAPYS